MPKKKADGEPQFTQAVLKLKIGSSASGPTKRMLADFEDVARECNRARDATAWKIMRWHEENPDWHKGDEGKKSKLPLPKTVGDKSGTTYLYNEIRSIVPRLYAEISSMLTQEVHAKLATKLSPQQWREHGKKYSVQWRAMIDHAWQIPHYKAPSIPVHNRSVGLYYQGLGLNLSSKQLASVRERVGNGSAILVPLFSTASGRHSRSALFRIHTRRMSRGHKRILRRIASGEWSVSESEICQNAEGTWFFHLTYKLPVQSLGLNKNRVAMVEPQYGEKGFPFKVFVHGDEKAKPWNVGNPNPLIENQKRLELKRITLQKRYEIRGAGAKGHGRGRMMKDIRPATRRIQDMAGTFIKLTVAEILRFCERHDCGTVCFRCPSDGFKGKTVIGQTFPQFGWSAFEVRLKAKMQSVGIPVVERVGEPPAKKKRAKAKA